MKIVIIVPVYNEAGALQKFLPVLKTYIDLLDNHNIFVLIFDSNSTDGTDSVIKEWQKQWIKLLSIGEPKKTGLGSAYLQGMRYAIDTLEADAVFQCDGDCSHDPKYLSGMIKLLEEGYDVIIGSRYIQGGEIDANWAWHRRLISSLGNQLAAFILSFKYRDYTSGFRLIRSSFLKPVIAQKFFSKQFAFQINLIWFLHRKHAKIKEFPICFIDRAIGYSKIPHNSIIQALHVLLMLRINDIKNYLRD